MQFRDLVKQYNVLKEDIDRCMVETAASGGYINGKAVKELEVELAEYVGVKHCISCANGTDALTLALKAWGIGKGDAVFVPDFTFFASAEVIAAVGATPIFVDVDLKTFNISSSHLEESIKQVKKDGVLSPKIIINVDLFGLPADYQSVKKIADKYNLYILEDAAQGFGGSINGKKACSLGDISATSFFPAKPLGCYGDGGAVFTNNDEWANLMKSYKVHGKGSNKYDNVRIGMNSRLDSIQAAILQVKFKAFKDFELESINKIANLYTQKLNKLEDNNILQTPYIPDGYYSSWAQYTIKLKDGECREELQKSLKENDIPTMIYYPIPMHKQTAFNYLKTNNLDCPNTNVLCKSVLSLPIYPYMEEDDVDKVCNIINNFFNK